jgi:hypothetical protein
VRRIASVAATAVPTVSLLSATASGSPPSVTYAVSYCLTETSGQSSAAIEWVAYLFDGLSSIVESPSLRVPASSSVETGVSVADRNARSVASIAAVLITFRSDSGLPGTAYVYGPVTQAPQ